MLISLLPAPVGHLRLAIALHSPQQTQVQGRELCPLHGLRRSCWAWPGALGVMWQQPSPCLLMCCRASTLLEPRQGMGSSAPARASLHPLPPRFPTPPTPQDPRQPAPREPGPQHCHVRRQLCSPVQAARLSLGQGSRCGNWLCPVLRMEMDFSFSTPSINHFFCLVLAKPKKKKCFMMQVT